MRVLLVPFAAAALFATANYSSAMTSDGAYGSTATSTSANGSVYQPSAYKAVPPLRNGTKIFLRDLRGSASPQSSGIVE